MTTRFRILSLDGGGVKGAYTASVLATIEEHAGCRLVDYFDLIAGSSTGGIIALGLALGLPASQIEQFYRDRGPSIFPVMGVTSRFLSRVSNLVSARYRPDSLRAALTEVLGDRRLGHAKTRLVIPAYDAVACDVHVFKTAHHAKLREDFKRSAVEVALATSAAPTYLPLYGATWGQHFLDGGVWANCPAIVAILEAQCHLNRRLDEVDLLRVGTTSEPLHIFDRARRGGVLSYGTSIVKLLLNAQEKATLAQVKVLLREDQVLSIDAVAKHDLFRLDGSNRLTELIALGKQAGRHHASKVIEMFLRSPADRFTPIHSL